MAFVGSVMIAGLLFYLIGAGNDGGGLEVLGLVMMITPVVLGVAYILVTRAIKASKAASENAANERATREREERDRLAALENQKRQRALAAQRHSDEQRRTGQELEAKNRYAVDQFGLLPRQLSNAHQYLDEAVREFREPAYIPFWTAIENATTEVANFIDSVNNINRTAQEYSNLMVRYEGTADPFAVSLEATEKLRVGEPVSQRIHEVVRPAHRDPAFSSIFLQMRGNAIMAAGFSNLQDALGRMTVTLSSALADVSSAVRSMESSVSQQLGSLDSSIGSMSGRLGSIESGIGSLNTSNAAIEAASRERVRQASVQFKELDRRQSQSIQMLNNIQHDRKPPLWMS